MAGMGLSTDVAVPVKSLANFIEMATLAVKEHYPDLEIILVAHMGDGNVHFIPRFNFERWKALSNQSEVGEHVRCLVHDVAAKLQGTFSAEHGVGYVLVEELERLRAPNEVALMRQIRQTIDPATLFNRGKLTRALRTYPGAETPYGPYPAKP